MKKHYLKTVEDVLELIDTDTRIYDSSYKETDTYYKWVNGVLCRFDKNGGTKFNDGIYLKAHDYYIYEEEPEQEATEEDVGKLCWFWDNEEGDGEMTILKVMHSKELYPYLTEDCNSYVHCRRLTPSEVEELTGYKVEEK